MPPTPEGGIGFQTKISDHLAIGAGYQRLETLRPLGETLAPHFRRGKRESQGSFDHARAAKDAVYRFVVVRFGIADDYLHRHLPRNLSGNTDNLAHRRAGKKEPSPVGEGSGEIVV
jgi:hypothetical protein